MHEKDGRYSIDADKSMDVGIETNILASLVRTLLFKICKTTWTLTGAFFGVGTLDGEAPHDRGARVFALLLGQLRSDPVPS